MLVWGLEFCLVDRLCGFVSFLSAAIVQFVTCEPGSLKTDECRIRHELYNGSVTEAVLANVSGSEARRWRELDVDEQTQVR